MVLATVVASDDRRHLGAKALYSLDADDRLVVLQALGVPDAWGDHFHAFVQESVTPRRHVGGATTVSSGATSKTRRVKVEVFPHAPGVRVSIEVIRPKPRLIIAGAGHIAQPTHHIAAIVGFAVTVLDDRPAFANRERFPHAEEIICDDFSTGVERVGIDRDCAVVVVTRGHLHDLEVLRALKGKEWAYLGMIGSKRRVLTVIDKLRQEQGTDRLIERLHAPIGLDIGAESPAEIALAIVSEVVAVLRGGAGGHLKWQR